MSEPKRISPLLDGFIMGDPISDHHGVRCCPAMHTETEHKYIVKIISIPASQKQVDALLLTGAYTNKEDVLAYFTELAEGTVHEAKLLQRLSQLEGFTGYTDWQLVPMEDGVGFDLYLLSPYRPTLGRYFRQEGMTHLGAVNLGLDLCAALTVCRRSGHLYVDLRPDNIFITDKQEYRIGDLGFIPLDSLKYASLPEKYHSSYTAPEITDAYSSLNSTLDIYAAGLILYQAYNNNQLPFEGSAPAEPLEPPAYADYEMAEIILKACDPDPANRWEDPVQMGQALVSYMQRNTVNDDPIIPPPKEQGPEVTEEEITEGSSNELEPTEEITDEATVVADEPTVVDPEVETEPEITVEAEEAAEAVEANEAEKPEDDDQFVIDGFPTDETVPDEDTALALEDTEVTEEVSEILAQADDLIAHEAPAPVVVPDPVEISIPDPINPEGEEAEVTEPAEEETIETVEEPEAEQIPETASDDSSVAVAAKETAHQPAKKQGISNKQFNSLIAILTTILILLLLAIGAFFYYEEYYLQPVRNISLSGHEDKLTVTLDTEIDNDLLSVVCKDAYGNSVVGKVSNNKASFANLRPGTKYTVNVQISGFHQLVGTTASSYTTAEQTSIVGFTAVTGDQDGTVILNFSVQGPENTAWRIAYSAPGQEEKIMPCTAHMAVITGLEVGVTYTFRLESVADLYVVGNDTIEHTVSKVVYPENLQVLGFNGTSLSVKWDAPADTAVESWLVRCYNTSGYDTTITVTEPKATFENLDITQGYTIDVKAAGMSESGQVNISANSITFRNINIERTSANNLTVKWEFEGTAPATGWRLLYTVDGSEKQLVTSDTNSCIISPAVPGGHYQISFELPGGVSLFGGYAEFNVAPADAFNGYNVSKSNMAFQMCRTPNKSGWKWSDVPKKDYVTEFPHNGKASFFVKLSKNPSKSEDKVATLFVIRDANGIPVASNAHTRTWNSMWDGRYCVIEMPIMPQTAGSYTVDIYFNGGHVHSQNFTVT